MSRYWILNLLGVSLGINAGDDDDTYIEEYAALVREANSTIWIVSDQMPSTVYENPYFVEALIQARTKGVNIQILAGPVKTKNTINLLRRKGAFVRKLQHFPKHNYAVIDGQHARIEETGFQGRIGCAQYIIHDYIHVSKLENNFRALSHTL